jgi:hypothetical protein
MVYIDIDNVFFVLGFSNPGQVMIFRLDWKKWLDFHPTLIRYTHVQYIPPIPLSRVGGLSVGSVEVGGL